MGAKPKYRSRLRIHADILTAIEQGGSQARTTRILYAANLSHDRLTEYLGQLKEKGLITETQQEDYTTYSLTKTGFDFLQEFRRIQNFAKAFGFVI